MGLPKQIAKQAAEADRLVRNINGANEPPPADDPPAPAPEPTPEPIAVQQPVPQPAPVATPQPPAPQPPANDEWKHKYDVLQGKYNAEVPGLQQQLQNALNAVANMGRELDVVKEQLATAKAQPRQVQQRVTAQDEATWGADMTDFVRRAAQEEIDRATAPLVAENERLRGQLEKVTGRTDQIAQTAQQTKEERFWLDLAELVPNWATMNTDHAFIQWLGAMDDMLGTTRQNALTEACNALNARRAASFFKAFLATLPPPVDPARELQTQVAPRGQRGGGQPTQQYGGGETIEIWSQEEIMQFYTDVNRGKWRHDPQGMAERRAQIDRAVAEGRVR